MPTETINALDLLEEQHAEVDELFGKIERANDPGVKRTLFLELADKVAAHATIEETLFYPSVMAKATHELLVESVEEHLSIKRILADLLELSVEDEHFDAKLTVMKEQLRHHAHDEEEDHLFPKVRRLLSADELAALGNELMAKFEELIEREPRMTVPSQTVEAAPLPM
jgi:hypothetical protein